MPSSAVLQAHEVGNSLEARVRVLRRQVWRLVGGLRDPMMRQIGLLVTRGCPARNDMCELKSIFDFIVKNVRYTGDIAFKDTFQSALRTLQYGGGDCDDMATLVAVLAMENGFQTKFRITSNTGRTWDHIYGMAGIPKHAPTPKQWVALDTTLGPGRFTSEPPRAKNSDFEVREG